MEKEPELTSWVLYGGQRTGQLETVLGVCRGCARDSSPSPSARLCLPVVNFEMAFLMLKFRLCSQAVARLALQLWPSLGLRSLQLQCRFWTWHYTYCKSYLWALFCLLWGPLDCLCRALQKNCLVARCPVHMVLCRHPVGPRDCQDLADSHLLSSLRGCSHLRHHRLSFAKMSNSYDLLNRHDTWVLSNSVGPIAL